MHQTIVGGILGQRAEEVGELLGSIFAPWVTTANLREEAAQFAAIVAGVNSRGSSVCGSHCQDALVSSTEFHHNSFRPNQPSRSDWGDRLPLRHAFDYEVLTSAELAQRLKVKESWVVDQSKRHAPLIPSEYSGSGSIGGIAGVPRSSMLGSTVAGYNNNAGLGPHEKEELCD